MSSSDSQQQQGSTTTQSREGSFQSPNANITNEKHQPQYQVAPGNYRVEQGGKTVGILFVFQGTNDFIRYEHWYLFSPKNNKYPSGLGTYEVQTNGTDAEIKLIPDKTILVHNQDPHSQPSQTAFGNEQTQPMVGISAAYIFCVNQIQPDVTIHLRKEVSEKFIPR